MIVTKKTGAVAAKKDVAGLDALAAKEKMSRTAMIVELVGRHLARNKELNAEKREEKTVYTRIPVEDLERLAELAGLDRRKRTDYIRGLVVSEIQLLVPDLEGESRG